MTDHIKNNNIELTNKNNILRNTYLLLSLTLIFSAITCTLSMIMSIQLMNPLLIFIIYLILLFCINKNSNNLKGLIFTFIFTGFLGYTIGPILDYYITSFSNGSEIILISLASTGLIFIILSSIAIFHSTLKLHKINHFLGIGTIVVALAILINLFLQITALHLTISIMISLISGGIILVKTHQIINHGEKNYILATISIYLSLLNIFLTILQLFGLMSDNNKG